MSKVNIKWAVMGAAFGYFFFHPLIHIISLAHYFGTHPQPENLASGISNAFSVSMLPWGLAFMLSNALIGILWGKIKRADEEKLKMIIELRRAFDRVKTLSGLLPICASCKNVRDDQGYWNRIEAYIEAYSEAQFSHGICPECAKKLYPEFYRDDVPKILNGER
ncbi:MAG: hypothetical protein JSW26_24140 [Desulfobacterales bacterium]|nr:MAG: hypothetical protein JSW26_24140 [Desulfobacterales bacterium]